MMKLINVLLVLFLPINICLASNSSNKVNTFIGQPNIYFNIINTCNIIHTWQTVNNDSEFEDIKKCVNPNFINDVCLVEECEPVCYNNLSRYRLVNNKGEKLEVPRESDKAWAIIEVKFVNNTKRVRKLKIFVGDINSKKRKKNSITIDNFFFK